jgi:hypothetical protein
MGAVEGSVLIMVRRATILALLLLAGCARSEEASLVADTNELQVERVRTPERDDEAIALGAWRDALQEDVPVLEFGPVGTPPAFSLRCDARRSIFLQRHGAAPAGDLPMMLVSTGNETRRLAVTNIGGTSPMLRASLPPSDNLVARLGAADARITIRVGDAAPLVLPPDPAIGAFIARCSSGGAAPPADAAGNAAAEAPAEAGNAQAQAAPAPAER